MTEQAPGPLTAADVAAMGLALGEVCDVAHVAGMRPHRHIALPEERTMTTEELQARIEAETARKLRVHGLREQHRALEELAAKAELIARNLEDLRHENAAAYLWNIARGARNAQVEIEQTTRGEP